MTESQSTAGTIARWGVVGFALLVVGALTLALGWPRTVSCAEVDPICDGSSGHEAFVWLGAALMLASVYPLMVHAVARGLALHAAADRESANSLP